MMMMSYQVMMVSGRAGEAVMQLSYVCSAHTVHHTSQLSHNTYHNNTTLTSHTSQTTHPSTIKLNSLIIYEDRCIITAVYCVMRSLRLGIQCYLTWRHSSIILYQPHKSGINL